MLLDTAYPQVVLVKQALRRSARISGRLDRSVRVSGGHRIADAEQLELAVRIAHDRLRFSGKQLVMRNFTEIARGWLQLEIELVKRDGAVVDDDLVNRSLLGDPAVIAADMGDELVAALFARSEPKVTVKVTSSFWSDRM